MKIEAGTVARRLSIIWISVLCLFFAEIDVAASEPLLQPTPQVWRVSESRLLPSSEIRLPDGSVWEHYRQQTVSIVAVLLLQAPLMAMLLYERRRRRLAEAATRKTTSDLLHLNRIITVGELSASIAHEVNQPLAGIVANANAGMRWLAPANPDLVKAEAAFKQIVAAGHHASNVIGNARALARRSVEERLPVDINELVRNVTLLERLEFEKHHVSLMLELIESLPEIAGDRVQLLQVILNLVRNSIEAMEASSTRILRIISQTDETGGVLVSVEDSGVGIDRREMDHIFDPFFTTKSQGLGIGLSICRSIIDSHNGRLWVTSTIGEGSAFHFALPKYGPGDARINRRTRHERAYGGNGRCLRS